MSLAAIMGDIRASAVRIGRPIRLMEVCGTHTVAAFRSGLRSLLPEAVELLSGPGCPVCVTPIRYVDTAIALARRPATAIATFGDMIRVPGTRASLERARADGARVQVVYSPLDALEYARRHADRTVVFLGVGFETTAPGVAWTIREAATAGVSNYRVLSAHKTMPRAMAALLEGGERRIDGFLCPGHVSAVTGTGLFEFIARDHGVPCAIAGFEGADMAEGILMLLRQIEAARPSVEIQYRRGVDAGGNARARAEIEAVFEPGDAEWRGFGVIPGSGLSIRPTFRAQDAAELLAGLVVEPSAEHPGCRCGAVLRGMLRPDRCPLFGGACTPDQPVGACMVSSEGSCAAHFRYRRAGS